MDFEKLITENLKQYDAIRPKNPKNSYTVLATLNDSTTGELLALATGTQANLKSHQNDIEDCHAESLLKRAYKRYLIDKIAYIISRHDDESSNNINDSIKQELGQQSLVLFVTQFPCGLVKRYEGDEPVDDSGDIIRRKPGRGTFKDGKIVYVDKENCLIKLNRWIKDGLQGKKLIELFDIRSNIKTMLVGDCEPCDQFDYDSSVESLKKYFRHDDAPDVQLCEHVRRDEFVFGADKQPHPVALVWWLSHGNPSTADNHPKRRKISYDGSHEFIVDGRKRGITRKQYLKDIPSNYLKISNRVLKEDLDKLEQSYRSLGSGD